MEDWLKCQISLLVKYRQNQNKIHINIINALLTFQGLCIHLLPYIGIQVSPLTRCTSCWLLCLGKKETVYFKRFSLILNITVSFYQITWHEILQNLYSSCIYILDDKNKLQFQHFHLYCIQNHSQGRKDKLNFCHLSSSFFHKCQSFTHKRIIVYLYYQRCIYIRRKIILVVCNLNFITYCIWYRKDSKTKKIDYR